ncbi:MAG: fibronectin type III domain-containing protein [Nitrospirota bacterium]|nr:fibronectin type III domain-containing protein [Nitrospirota bacterium]
MTALTKKQFSPRTRVTEIACIPLRLTEIVAGLLLTMTPLLTGCGGGGGGGDASAAPAAETGITASLAWHPTQDASVYGYFIHYGRQSPGRPGSCSYESSMYVDSPEATVTNLDPDTRYHFAVSAYNGLESACSSEVSTVTPPPASPDSGGYPAV